VGAGEGRLSRELHALGHRVVAIEPSPVLAAAAREAEPRIEVVQAPAEAIPLEDGAADLAVASMSLMNIDVLDDALRELARVLSPGGRLAFSIPHPAASAGDDYFGEHTNVDERERDGVRMEFHDRHRPLATYFAALAAVGFAVQELREPVPDDEHVAAFPEVAVWRRRPCFLQARAALR
jgi:SAM-dependent methyltransferase